MIRGMRVILPCVAVGACSSVYVCMCVCARAPGLPSTHLVKLATLGSCSVRRFVRDCGN
jgi:hypothetical protein